jgi:hypothetical protein
MWHSGGGTSLQGLSNEDVLNLEILINASSYVHVQSTFTQYFHVKGLSKFLVYWDLQQEWVVIIYGGRELAWCLQK